MNSNNSAKYIIVTGANKGIGLQIVKDLLKLDITYSVILTSRDINRGKDAINEIESNQNVKGRLFYEQLDIESEDSINSFVKIIKDKYKSIYALINNAAVFYEKINSFEELATVQISEKETKSAIQVNVRGTIKISEKILPYLEENGRIIFLSSLAGLQQFHQDDIIKRHNKQNLTEKEYFELLDEYEAKALKYEHTSIGYHNSIYYGTKLFLNTYVRSVIKNLLKRTQTAFSVHPGVIKTDANPFTETPVTEGTISTLKVINYSDKEALENNCLFLDDKGNIHEY